MQKTVHTEATVGGTISFSRLGEAVDFVDEHHFFGRRVAKVERERAAAWIAGRQGLAGSYAGMFAPTPADWQGGVRVFTGEAVRLGAAARHILGEEACRALIVLNVARGEIRGALDRATRGMLGRLGPARAEGEGMYCCGICSCSLWRHLAAGGLDKNEERLAAAAAALKLHRKGDGQWRRFPYYYTLLALSEMQGPAVKAELQYAAGGCERLLKRKAKDDRFDLRRRALAARVMERCG